MCMKQQKYLLFLIRIHGGSNNANTGATVAIEAILTGLTIVTLRTPFSAAALLRRNMSIRNCSLMRSDVFAYVDAHMASLLLHCQLLRSFFIENDLCKLKCQDVDA